MSDPFDLERFVEAQAAVYTQVLDELRSGRKRSHWIWFIFPQVKGLGFSSTSHRYGIGGLDEATAYLGHPLLGPRLVDCTTIVNRLEDRSAQAIFGFPDYLKFRSSMTLFAQAANADPCFAEALAKYYNNEADQRTLDLLKTAG